MSQVKSSRVKQLKDACYSSIYRLNSPVSDFQKTIENIRELLDSGVPADALYEQETETLLIKMCCHDGTKERAKVVIDLLLEHGADINARRRDGKTPLLKAILSNDKGIDAAWFLDRGASINAVDDHSQCIALGYVERYSRSHSPTN